MALTDLKSLIEKARELEAAATKGPWEARRGTGTVVIDASPDWDHCVLAPIEANGNTEADRQFIPFARNHFPEMLSLLEAQAQAIEVMRAELKYIDDKTWFDKKKEGNWACMWCDCGGAGYSTNDDGHDTTCPASHAHQALAQAQTILEKAHLISTDLTRVESKGED